MSKAKRANESNLPPHWKVRIWMFGGGVLHVISETEPKLEMPCGALIGVEMKPITNTEHGDTIGHINWNAVSAVSWRYAPLVTEVSE